MVQKKTAIVSLLFLLFSFVFAITNFYLSRYILYVIPIVIMMGSCGIVAILENISSVPVRNILVALTVATGCILTVRKMDTGVFRDTSDMSYLHVVNCVQKSIDWTQQQPWRDSIIEAEFPVSQAISDTRNGYFSGKPFNHSVNFEKKAAYGLLFSLDDEQPPAWNGARFTVIKRFDDLFAHVSVVKYQ